MALTPLHDLERRLRPPARLPARLLVFSFAMAVAALLLGHAALERRARAAEAQAQVERWERLQRRAQQRVPSKKDLDAQARWSTLDMEQAFPWQSLFAALERGRDPDIELLEFRPDKRQRSVILKGVARDRAALERYLALLAEQPVLTRPYLAREGRLVPPSPDILEFEIHAFVKF